MDKSESRDEIKWFLKPKHQFYLCTVGCHTAQEPWNVEFLMIINELTCESLREIADWVI